MSEMSKQARRDMRAKIQRLVAPTDGKVDASDYGPEEVLHSEAKTGMRPVSRRAFKSGGKVDGHKPAKNAGKSPRKGIVNDYINRDDKDANEERDGHKHVGGLKSGGRARRADGGKNAGDTVPTSRMAFESTSSRLSKAAGLKSGGSVSDGAMQGTRPTGGRLARKDGGKTGKGKVNVNIIIAQGKPQQQPAGQMPMSPNGAPPPGIPVPMGMPPGPPPQAAAPPPMPMPMGGPPPGAPGLGAAMPRKRGGRAYRSYKDVDAGSGSGPGRLEKSEIAVHKG